MGGIYCKTGRYLEDGYPCSISDKSTSIDLFHQLYLLMTFTETLAERT